MYFTIEDIRIHNSIVLSARRGGRGAVGGWGLTDGTSRGVRQETSAGVDLHASSHMQEFIPH